MNTPTVEFGKLFEGTPMEVALVAIGPDYIDDDRRNDCFSGTVISLAQARAVTRFVALNPSLFEIEEVTR